MQFARETAIAQRHLYHFLMNMHKPLCWQALALWTNELMRTISAAGVQQQNSTASAWCVHGWKNSK